MTAMAGKRRVCIFVVVSIAAVSVTFLTFRDYSRYFKSRKGTLVSAKTRPQFSDAHFTHQGLSLESDSGLKVECGLLVPNEGEAGPPYPAVVLLGGVGTGKRAVSYVSGISDVVVAAPDYSFPKEMGSAGKLFLRLPAVRRAALETVPSAMLLVDYLSRRPDVDPKRIVLLGISFGAPFVPCIAANDTRPAVAAMAFGGGDLRRILRSNVRRFAGPVATETLSIVGALLLRPIEPMRYADKISPRPLLMINGSQDRKIPRDSVELFFRKAKEPKKLIWLEAPHLKAEKGELISRIIEILKVELERLGVLQRESAPS